MMQGDTPSSLAIGTQVSAKYKGAFCEATIRNVIKEVKCRITFKKGLGSLTLSDDLIKCKDSLIVGANVLARHPDRLEYLEAVINKIQDQSRYTVVFDDGDITTLRRNSLCMKSGKHYNASESLDNLPLTHPEHFSSPVSGIGTRRRRVGGGSSIQDSDEYDSLSEGDTTITTAEKNSINIGCVIWAETDKKKSKDSAWFPALIVAPSATDVVKIDTKEEFLIRSFKDGRYYTVSRCDVNNFNKELARNKAENSTFKNAVEKAITYIEKKELPPHWDKNVLFNTGEDKSDEASIMNNIGLKRSKSSTTGSESDEEFIDDQFMGEHSREEKDHLVAELYKHMEDRGQPINRTPSIVGKDVDLYLLFRIVNQLGGHSRVTSNNLWRKVTQRLGFETTWCVNQVRIHYKRYLMSFEELYRSLGERCTLDIEEKSNSAVAVNSDISRSQIGRIERIRPKKIKADLKEQPNKSTKVHSPKNYGRRAIVTKNSLNKSNVTESAKKCEEALKCTKNKKLIERKRNPPGPSRAELIEKRRQEVRMSTRPKRNSILTPSSSGKKNLIKEQSTSGGSRFALQKERTVVSVRMDRDKEIEYEAKKLQDADLKQNSAAVATGEVIVDKSHRFTSVVDSIVTAGSNSASNESENIKNKSKTWKKIGENINSKILEECRQPTEEQEERSRDDFMETIFEETQHLASNVVVRVGDKIKVFYLRDIIYDAKVINILESTLPNDNWPRYYVHYQGWNARYDEWISRSRIKENLSWSKERNRKPNSNTSVSTTELNASNQIPAQSISKTLLNARSSREERKKEIKKMNKITDKLDSDGFQSETLSPRGSRSPLLSKRRYLKESGSDEESNGSLPAKRGRPLCKVRQKPNRSVICRKNIKRRPMLSSNKRLGKTLDETILLQKRRGRKPKETEDNIINGDNESEGSVNSVSSPPNISPSIPDDENPNDNVKEEIQMMKEETLEIEEDPYDFKDSDPFDDVKFETPKKCRSPALLQHQPVSPSVTHLLPSPQSSNICHYTVDVFDKKFMTNDNLSHEKNTESCLPPDVNILVSKEEQKKEVTIPIVDCQNYEHSKTESELKSQEDKPIFHMTKKQQELFPFLSAIRSTAIKPSETINICSKVDEEAVIPSIECADEVVKTEVVSPIEESSSLKSVDEDDDNVPLKKTGTERKNVKRKKRKPHRKPISLEFIDSESSLSLGSSSSSSEGEYSDNMTIVVPQVVESDLPSMNDVAALVTDGDYIDLACAETIPGSPVPMVISCLEPDETRCTSETPFATVPKSDHIPSHNYSISPPSDDPVTLTVSLSKTNLKSIEVEVDTPVKSPVDSSEMEIDSLCSETKAGSEDSRMDIEGSLTSRPHHARRAKERSGRTENSSLISSNGNSIVPQRRRLTRTFASNETMRGKGRKRHGSGRNRVGHGAVTEDSDEFDMPKDPNLPSLGSLDNEALALLMQRSPRSSKYNFYVELDSSMDSAERISRLETNLEALRKTYATLKCELALIERRRKKIRRKERDRANGGTSSGSIGARITEVAS